MARTGGTIELDFKLGEPLGTVKRIRLRPVADHELLENGGFEGTLKDTWRLWCDQKAGNAATAGRDTTVKHAGGAQRVSQSRWRWPKGRHRIDTIQPFVDKEKLMT